jgi:hypothetical protein
MHKEYGKLTREQFKTTMRALGEFKEQREDFADLMAKVPESRINEVFTSDYCWSDCYELPFTTHMALVVVAFNRTDWLSAAAASDDPQQFVLDTMDTVEPVEPHPGFQLQHLIGLVWSLQRTILSILLYQRSLSGLVQEVRETGSREALFKAIRVDRTTMNCPTIADKIALAELRGNKPFFCHLRSAIAGPSRKHWMALCDLRYSLYLLRELGFNKMTDDQLEQLLIHTLKVYPNTPSARKNLRAQYQQSKQIKTI